MNPGYMIYQAERTHSSAEQREIYRLNSELAAAAMPMMNTSPQNPSKAVSTLCLAGQGLRPCGPPGGPYSTCVGGWEAGRAAAAKPAGRLRAFPRASTV